MHNYSAKGLVEKKRLVRLLFSDLFTTLVYFNLVAAEDAVHGYSRGGISGRTSIASAGPGDASHAGLLEERKLTEMYSLACDWLRYPSLSAMVVRAANQLLEAMETQKRVLANGGTKLDVEKQLFEIVQVAVTNLAHD